MDMHWGAEEAKREAERARKELEKKQVAEGKRPMTPAYWHDLARSARALRVRLRREWLEKTCRHINGLLAAFPPDDGRSEAGIDLSGLDFFPPPDEQCVAALKELYEQAGWRQVCVVGHVLRLKAPEREG